MSKELDHDVICMMPWIHMHIWPNGNTMPCCMSDSNDVFGNVNQNTINEIINSDKFKTLRKEMISGVKPTACSRCYELEETADSHTLRRNSLNQFSEFIPLIDATHEDGSIDDFKMRYMDIRFSNLCNMKCRTCGPELSSKWYDDQKTLYPEYDRPKFIDLRDTDNFMTDLTEHLDYVKEVYFAGGEALITPQHYEVLEYWLKNNRTDVKLRYTTNFSVLNYKSYDILDYWKTFDDVRVAASLDTFGKFAEYSRSGTKWDKVVANRKKMLEHCPDVYFEITPTVSVFNIFELFEFHSTWVEQGLLDINNIRINILTNPRRFSITILTPEMKTQVEDIFRHYIHWLEENGARPDVIQSVKGIIEHMNSQDNTDIIPEFMHEIGVIDSVREENFVEVYQEFEELWNG